jgi:hypothetical protein
MKTSTKATLVSGAIASVMGSAANALPPSSWTDGSMQVFYAAGDSDAVQAVNVAVSKLLYTPSVDVYTDNSGTASHPQSARYLIISGVMFFGNGSGQNIGFIYKYNGSGFLNGAVPHAVGGALAYPSLASLATAVSKASTPNAGAYPSPLNPDFNVTSPVYTNMQTPDWGITDEEERLFNFAYNLGGANGSKPFPSLAGHTQPFYVQPFGVAVTAALYNHKKKWSKAEIAAVLSGSILQWSQLNDDSGQPLPASLGQVTLIDGDSGSGAKVAGNSYFLDYPGGVSAAGGYITPNSVAQTFGRAFPNGGYTGALNTAFPTSATEIQDIDEPSSAAEVVDLLEANTAGIGALAILGLECPPVLAQSNTGTNDYAFVAINGVYPDSETGADNINSSSKTGTTQYSNIINGSYDFAYQTAFNDHATSLSPLPAFQLAVFNNLKDEHISGAHTGFTFPASAQGVLLDPQTSLSGDAGNLNWSRTGNSAGASRYIRPVTAAAADPLF